MSDTTNDGVNLRPILKQVYPKSKKERKVDFFKKLRSNMKPISDEDLKKKTRATTGQEIDVFKRGEEDLSPSERKKRELLNKAESNESSSIEDMVAEANKASRALEEDEEYQKKKRKLFGR